MTSRKTLLLNWMVAFAAALALLGCAGSHQQRERKDHLVWFVHATDPHIFVLPAQGEQEDSKAARSRQQELNEKAFSDMLDRIPSLPGGDGPPAFLLLTGDLGLDPCSDDKTEKSAKECWSPDDPKKLKDLNDRKDSMIKETAKLLGASPVQDIYLVAGSNDIAREAADDSTLHYFNELIGALQLEMATNKSNVQLHNLTGCYDLAGGASSTCYADIDRTDYRLIGLPSYSFENKDTDYKTNKDAQEKQFDKFSELLEQARKADKKVLIASHVPEIDDPYTTAQDLFDAKNPPPPNDNDPTNTRSKWSTWNVSKKVLDDWRGVLASDVVVGVLAGYLHDSHKEIYRQPFAWSSANEHRFYRKLFLAPPLAVKNQDTSTIQARGFEVVRLEDDRIEPQIYWYDWATRKFSPDPKPGLELPKRQGWHWAHAIVWLWQLDEPQPALDRMAVLLIAFLAAFLTVVQVWQIPPAENPLAGQETAPASGGGGGGAAAAKPAFEPSPFASNFGKTVITGLAGLAAEMVLKAFEGKPSSVDKQFYIVWFVVFFFLLLILMALSRAFAEAVRTRLAIIHYPLARQAEPSKQWVKKKGVDAPVEEPVKWYTKFWRSLAYWVHRFVGWIFSLRVPLLTLFDTFINLIQGKNQTLTRVFSDKIIDQQRNVVRTADAIRENLNTVIRNRLSQGAPNHRLPDDVRVNISVLSADQTNVYYIARTPGSSIKPFGKRSVAWVSVFTGKIRWYKESYFENKDLFPNIVLFDNSDGTIAGDEPQIHLSSHYQERAGDYEAFILFPVPWPTRGFGSDYVKGAIHISFRNRKDFEQLWSIGCTQAELDAKAQEARERIEAEIQAAPNDAERQKLQAQKSQNIQAAIDAFISSRDPVLGAQKTYSDDQRAIEDWCRDSEVRAAVREAVAVLGELLRGFNENIYNSSGGSDQPI